MAASQESTKVERTVVGMCLRDAEALGRAIGCGVSPTDFETPELRTIFAAMAKAEVEGKPHDLPAVGTIHPELVELLVDLSEAAPVSQNVEHYAGEVAARSRTRAIHEGLRDAYRALQNRKPFDPIEPAISAAVEAFERTSGLRSSSGPTKMEQSLTAFLKVLEDRATDSAAGKSRLIPTGIEALDFVLNGGWQPGRLYVVAARPGVGKTTFAMSAAKVAAISGKAAGYFTLEMLNEELTERVVSAEAMVSGRQLARGDLTDDEISRIFRAADQIHKLPLWYDDSFRGDFSLLKSRARRQARKGALDILFVDYLQLLRIPGSRKETLDQLTEITADLKLMAIDLKIPIVAVSAINRAAEKMSDDEGPSMAHLKGSGSIEQDGDSIIILHRKEEDDGKVWFHIAKNRGGVTRRFPVGAEMAFSKFTNLKVNME